MSSKVSRTSIPVSFGMSKFGASLCAIGCPNRFGEGAVGAFPGPAICGDRAEGRVSIGARCGLAARRKLRDLARRCGDVRARQERCFSYGRRSSHEPGEPHANWTVSVQRIGFAHRVAQFAINTGLALAGHGEGPWFAARLMPDQRMHELWIDAERAQGDQGDKVHHGRSQLLPIGCRACIEAEIIPHPASTGALHARLRWRAEACRSSARLMSRVRPSS